MWSVSRAGWQRKKKSPGHNGSAPNPASSKLTGGNADDLAGGQE